MDKEKKYSNITCMFFILFFCFSPQSLALYVESDISDFSAKDGFSSKKYVNNTKSTNIYSLSVKKILKPGENEIEIPIEDGELLFSPKKKVLLPNEWEFFKFYFNGKKDNRERYYRIIISELSLSTFEDEEIKKSTYILPKIGLDTYLIIRPAEINFDYFFNGKSLKNTGNTYFRVVIHNSCNDENPNYFYLLPNEEFAGRSLQSSGNKYLIFMDRIILLEKKCTD
ncbi:fimbrial protein [Providencia huaxiensis]